jgi:hypothetical protein
LHFSRFFENIYEQYDLRFVYGAANLATKTRRLAWDPTSPCLSDARVVGLMPRIAAPACRLRKTRTNRPKPAQSSVYCSWPADDLGEGEVGTTMDGAAIVRSRGRVSSRIVASVTLVVTHGANSSRVREEWANSGLISMRRDGRVVDGGGLENHCTGNGAGGSNPSPSARSLRKNVVTFTRNLSPGELFVPAVEPLRGIVCVSLAGVAGLPRKSQIARFHPSA